MKAGYCRVSTLKGEQDLSLEHQQAALLEAGCEVTFVERKSAYKRHVRRKEWEKFKGFIADGVITHAVLVNLQRTTRACESEAFFDLCRGVGCQVTVLDGTDVDTESIQGFLMVRMQDTVNKMESMLKSKSVLAAHARLKKAGHTCIGKCPFGYRYDGKQPEVDQKQWKKAQRLWSHLKRNDYQAAKTLREGNYHFSVVGLIKWMKNPMLRGEVYGKPNGVEALITEQEYRDCLRALKSRSFHSSNRRRVERLLSGLVQCDCCKKPLYYMSTNNKRRLKCMNAKCDWYGRGLAEWKIRDQVIEVLTNNAERLAKAQADDQPQAKGLSAEQRQWQAQLDQMLQLQKSGVPGLETGIADLRLRLTPDDAPVRSANWADLTDAIRCGLDRFTDKELRPLLTEFLADLIYVGDPDRIKIRLVDDTSESAT